MYVIIYDIICKPTHLQTAFSNRFREQIVASATFCCSSPKGKQKNLSFNKSLHVLYCYDSFNHPRNAITLNG